MIRRDLNSQGQTLLFAAATAIDNDLEAFGQDLGKSQAAVQSFSDHHHDGQPIDMAVLEACSVNLSLACQILNKKYDGFDAAQKDLLKNFKKENEKMVEMIKDEKKEDEKKESPVKTEGVKKEDE